MQLTKLQMIEAECNLDFAEEGAKNLQIFCRAGEEWMAVADKTPATPNIAEELRKCVLRASTPYRAPRATTVGFAIPGFDAVLWVDFEKQIKSPRLSQLQKLLARSIRHASNEYSVKFNPNTGLLAKGALKEEIALRLGTLKDQSTPGADSEVGAISAKSLCLLALDIDHFKQINDTHGHRFGDVVLKAFAIRVERAVSRYVANIQTLSAHCAHVSGEEFFVVASGNVNGEVFEGLADAILTALRGQILPGEDELALIDPLSTHGLVDNINERARKVTCSIGGVVVGAVTSSDHAAVAESLLQESDLALYKSKAQGRDRVTFLSMILNTGGRVLEHKVDAQVIVIDIGSDVGVVVGQEFTVFHPDFYGDSHYIVDDGRSKKSLGRLPKSPLCDIVVFAVDKQIAFCRHSVLDQVSINVPERARLELVPLGSLSKPSSAGLGYGGIRIAHIRSIADTKNFIGEGKLPPKGEAFAVITLKNEADLLQNFGPVSVNRSLIAICKHLIGEDIFKSVGQSDATEILLELSVVPDNLDTRLRTIMAQANAELTQRAEYAVGIFSPKAISALKLNPTRIERVDMSRYAAANASANESREHTIETFSIQTAENILDRARNIPHAKGGLIDYERMLAFGIKSAGLHNRAGLLANLLADTGAAEAYYRRAVEMDPAMLVFRLNLITSLCTQERYDEGLRQFNMLDHTALEKKYVVFPNSTIQIANLLTQIAATSKEQSALELARVWVDRACALPQQELGDRSRVTLSNISSRLAGLERPH